jgi:hypothetical protein
VGSKLWREIVKHMGAIHSFISPTPYRVAMFPYCFVGRPPI